jgi:iron complex outermembrane receptor protein
MKCSLLDAPSECVGNQAQYMNKNITHSLRMVGAPLLGVLLSFVTANAQNAPAATPPAASEGETVKMQAFEVTGSRIKRLDSETVSPVVVLRADDMRAQGFTTIADAIRALPFNNGQALTPTDSGTSFTPGVNSFNLRGLGNNNTLVLVNGRRAVPYAAPGFNGFQTVFDLNSIPEAAIESVEILKDGGSALYGSDAVAGVVNFKLKRDYEGVFVSTEVGDYFDTGALLKKASVVTGGVSSTGKTNLFVAASWAEQAAVYARDISYAADADKTSVAGDANPAYVISGINTAAGYNSFQDYLDEAGFTNPVDDGWFDNRSSSGYPGRVLIGSGYRTFRNPTNAPTVAGSVAGTNYYNFQEVAGLFPAYENLSVFTSARHDFSENIYGFLELSFTRNHALSDAAPTPAVLSSEQGLTAGSVMTIPSYNAYNPWATDITAGNRRLVELGNRVNDVTSETPRLLAGLGGKIPTSGLFQDWTWEAGILYSKNTVSNLNRNSVADYGLQQALNGLTRQGDGSLKWNPATPQNQRVYFNWFGLNEQAFADFLSIENPTTSSLEYTSYDLSAGGTIGQLPAGPIGVSVGAERRSEDMADVQTDLNATSNIVGGSAGTSSFGSRDVTSVFAEVNLPIVRWLEVQVAGRYEDYSDKGFKDEARPKVGFKLRPLDWLIVRGSYSESFKAPDLAYLYTGSTNTFTSSQYLDPVTGQNDQIQIRVAGNPNLQPETTDTYYFGVTLEPQKGLLRGLNVSVDYVKFEQSNLLAQLTDFYSYSDFLTRAAAGEALFASKVVRDPSNQRLLYIADDYSNISTAEYTGFDFEASYRWKTKTLGHFLAGVSGTYLDAYKIDGDNVAGSSLTPRFNANANFNWTYSDWQWNVFGVYRGHRSGTYGLGYFTDPDIDSIAIQYKLKKQITVNTSVSYRGFRGTTITAGVNNVLNDTPPVDPFEGSGTTPGVNDPYPPFWYVRLERQF